MTAFLLGGLALLFGLVFLLSGYRVYLVLLPVWGFFAGLWAGAEATSLILGTGFLGTVTGWIVGFILGIISASLAYLFHEIYLTIIAGAIGYAIGSGVMNALGLGPGLLSFAAGLVVGLVAVAVTLVFDLKKKALIFLTAMGGSNLIVLAFLLVFGRVSVDSLRAAGSSVAPILQDSLLWGLAWLVVALIGYGFQLRSQRDYTFTREDYVEAWG